MPERYLKTSWRGLALWRRNVRKTLSLNEYIHVVSALYDKTKCLCNIMLVMFLNFLLPVRPCCMKSEGWPVVVFCPHVGSTEVFGMESKQS